MRKRIAAIVFSVLAFFLSVIPQAYCLPQGQSVETGSATFDQPNSSTLIITAADKTVINFNSFSIAPNETVSFIQPSSTASVLSRVNSGISSVIAGFLNANGILFLVNSAGINFTPTAQVNVGSLVASTLAISTNNFIKGNYIFEHQDGAAYAQVLNEGRISADNVALIASAVNNTGIIAAKAGTVNLASGNKTTVSFDARGLIQVEVNSETSEKVLDSNGVSVKDAVANSGSITAREVYMTTKTALGVFESAVNQGGIVRASAITEEKGVIKLVGNEDIQISGTLDAGAGGSVDVLTSGNISVNSKLKTIGNSVLAAGKNIKLNADITTASGNLSLLADNNFDGLGSFLQIQGSTISTLDYGDITIQASGESTLANINSAGDLILKQAGAPVTFTQWPGSAVTTQGSLTINPGVTLTATDTNYNIGRDWRNLGNFIPGASTVNLTGPNNARIFGSNNFFNLIVDTPQKLVAVEPETTQAIINNLVLRGSFGKLLVIGSIDPTKQWSILPFGATDISYILLGDCVNIRGPPLKAIHSSSAGNLTNFDLDPYWTGQGQANNWSEPDNWDTGTIPTQFDTVTFDGVTGLNPNKDSIVDSAFQGTIDNLYINGYTGTITLARDLTLQGDFSHKTGSFDAATYPVIFIDASKPSNISGNTTFYNLTCVTPGKLLIFEAGSTQTINASFTLSGTSDNLIVLRSSSSYTQWIINNIGDTESVSCVDIQDANNIGSLITATNVIDSGNNSGFQLILIDPTLYRSVGTNSADLNTSPRTVTISGTTATFNGAMPDNVGVGDVLQYVISSTYYLAFITGRTSSTVYTVNNSSGGTPQAASAGQVVNVYRAYNSLANWQSQTVNTTIDSSVISSVNPSKGLVTAGTVMMVPCYADGLDTASVTITGWTTSATNYIQIYTPYQTSEVGASQRHSGVWDDTKYRLEVTGAYPISNLIGNIRIDGLQIKLTLTSGSAIYGAFYTNNATTAGTNYISNNIVVGVLSGTASTTRGIIGEANSSAVIMYVWNNVVYGFINGTTDEVGIRIGSGGSTTTMYAYNNTVSNCYVGINLGAGTLIAKNNLISSCATAASGTFAAGTDYNATNNSSMGYTVTDSGNIHDHLGQTFSFVNDTNKDFHLASNDAGATGYGVDLSATFTTDIHGQARSSGNWDIGADQAGAYWILGGTGNWSSTTNWSDSSGGPSGQVVPTSKTPVFFDANSGTGTATVDSAANALHLGCTGYTGTLALSAGLSIYGNLTLVSGMTFTPNTNTVTLTGTGASNTITSGGLSFYNLTQSGTASTDTYTLQDPLVVSHTLTLTTGTLDTKSTGSYAITVGSADPVNGNFDQSSITSKLLARSSLITLNGNGTFKADGTKDYTQYNSASLKLNGVNTLTYTHLTSSYENGFYNLTVGQSGNTTTISDYLTAISLLTVGSGTLSGGSNTLYLRGGTPLSFDAGSVVSIDSLGFQVPNQSIPSLTKGYDCNIRLYTSNQTITQTGDVKLNGTKSLYINGNGAEDRVQTWKTDGYNLTVGGTIYIGASADTGLKKLDATRHGDGIPANGGRTSTISVGGNWLNYGTTGTGLTPSQFIADNSTVILTGTGASNTITSGQTNSPFYNLTQNGTASTDTYTLQDALVVSHTLTLTTGTLDTKSTGSYAITVGSADPVNGNFDQSSITSKLVARSSLITLNGNGTFKADGTKDSTQYNSASLTLNGVNTLTYTHNSDQWWYGFYNLTVGQSTNTTTLSSYLAVLNLLTVGSGTLTGAGSIYLSGSTPLSFDAASAVSVSNLYFQKIGSQAIPALTKGYDCNIGVAYYNQTITQTGDVVINGTKTLSYVDAGGVVETWKTDGYNLTVGGNLTIGNASATALQKLDATRFGDGIPANGGRTSTISVGGNWLNYGTTGTGLTPSVFIADNSTVILTGTGASNTITSGQTNSPFYNLTQSGTASTDTYTLQDPLVVSHTLTLTTGTLDTKSTGSYAITVGSANPVNGNFDQSSVNSKFVARSSLITLNGNGTFTADGTKDQTQYNAASLTLNGVNTLTYNHLTSFSTNGFYNLTVGQSTNTTTLASLLTVMNLLTVGSGTLTGYGINVYLYGGTALSFDAASVVSVDELYFQKTSGAITIPSLTKGYDCIIRVGGGTSQVATQTGDVVINGTKALLMDGGGTSYSTTWKTDGYNLTVGGLLKIGYGSDTGLKKLDATRYGDGIPANGGRTSTITVGGNWINYGTTGTGLTPSQFIADNSTVILTGTGASNTLTSGVSNSPFYNLTQSGTASTDTYTLQDALVVSHTLTLTTGTLDTKSTGSYAITVGSADPVNGNFDQSSVNSKLVARSSLITLNGNGTFKADGTKDSTQYNSASLTLNGVNTLTYTHLTTSYANGFYNLTVGQSTNTTTLSSYFAVRTLLTVGSGTLTGGINVYLYGATPLSFDAASVLTINAIYFERGTSQTIPSLTKGYDCSIVVDDDSLVTQTGNVVLNGLKYLIINGGGGISRVNTWKTDGYDLTVGNNLQIGLGSDTGLKKLDATRFGDGIPANGGRTSTISVGGNWLNYGTTGTGLTPSVFIADNSTVILTGTGASNTITSGQTNSPFYNLTQSGTASTDTYTLQDPLVVSHTLTLTTGTLDTKSTGSYAVTIGSADPVNGNFSQATTAKFTARSSLITLNGNGTFTADGTVDETQYNSASLTLNGVNTLTYTHLATYYSYGFYNLTVGQSTNTTTLSSQLTVLHLLTVGSGTLTGNDVFLKGSTPLSFNAASVVSVGTLLFVASGSQTIPSLTNGYDCNIRIGNNAPTVTQTGDVVINGTKYFLMDAWGSQGDIITWKTDGYNFTVGGNLTIGAGSDTGLKKLDATRFGDGIPANGGRTSTISVGGNWLNYGTTGTGLTPSQFIADNSTVILTGTGASNTITSGVSNSPFYNLTQSGTASTDTYTLQDALVVSHTLTLTTGTLDTKSTGSYAITVGSADPVNGNFDQSSITSKLVARSSLITLNGNGTFKADGTKDQTQYNAASLVLNGVNTLTYNNFTNYTANGFYNLTVGQSTHTTTLSSNFTVLNLLTVGSGTLTGGSAQVFLLGSTPLSFDAASVVSIYILWFNKAGSQTIPSLAKGYDCHIYLNATPQTVTQTGDVVLNGTRTLILTDSIAAAGSNTWKTDGYNLTVGGNLQIGRGSDTGLKKLDATKYGDGIPANGGRTSTISVGGNWINYGTTGTGLTPSQFIADNSTVILTGTGASNTITSGVSNSPFYNLTQNGSGGTYALQDALIVTNTLTLTNGTFSVGGKTLTLNGPAIAGTPANLSTTSSSSLVFGGSSSGVNIPSSVTALNNLTINNTNGVTLNSSPAISGTLTLTSGALGANGYNIGIAGDWTNNGGTFTYGSGTVTFNGAGAQAINGTSNSQTFNNLIIQKAAGTTLSVGGSTTSLTVNNLTETTGNFIAPATLNINGNLTITGGTFTAGANTNIKGGWSKAIAATFTPNSGTVTFTGTGASAISGSSAFYNLTCATAGKTLTFTADTAQTVTNSLTLTGTAANPIIINDTGAGAVPKLTVNSSATQSINNVSITNNDASGGIQLVARGTGSSLHGVVTNWALGSTGTTFTWTGLVSSDWNASGNWDLGLVPSSTDKVIMPSGTPNQPALTGSISFVNLDLNVSLDVGSYTLTISGNLTGSGTIQGVSPTLSVEGYIGIFNHPINMSVTGTPTIYAGSMFNNTSIALSGVKRPYNFPGAIPGFVFINGHLEDKIGQNTIRPVLNTGLNPLYRGTNNFIAPVPTMITVPMFMPMRGFGVMPMPAPVPAAIPLPAPVPVPIVVPIPSIAPAVHMPPVIAPEEFIGARTHSILPQIATSETFLGNIAEANLPEPLFRGIATSVNLPLPVTFEEFRGSLAGVNLPQPAIAPGFKGISSEGLLPPVIAPEEFIGARTHSILPQIATLETFLGNIAEVNLPEPLFRGIATSVNLPLPVIFEEFRGSLAGVNLPQPAIAPGFKGISLKTAIPIVESLVIKEIVPGTRVELMFPGGKNIIPTYGIGIPFGVEGPVMDTKIRLEKEKGKQER